MVLRPDLDTFRVLPYDDEGGRVARLLCDIYNPDGSPFAGCPRHTLRRQITRASALGFDVMMGVEAEFYIFQLDGEAQADHAGPTTAGDTSTSRPSTGRRRFAASSSGTWCRWALRSKGATTKSPPASTRSTSATPRRSRRRTTWRPSSSSFGTSPTATATSPPSCRSHIFGQAGSGMHTSHSLFRDGLNAFFDGKAQWELSPVALHYIAGLLRHARGFCAVHDPLSWCQLQALGAGLCRARCTWRGPCATARR